MRTRPPFQLELELSRFLNGCGKSQQFIALEAGVSQASVSRASRPQGRKRITKELIHLCNYAKIATDEPLEKPRPGDHAVLMKALYNAWDGTQEHALGLARVICEVGKLRQKS